MTDLCDVIVIGNLTGPTAFPMPPSPPPASPLPASPPPPPAPPSPPALPSPPRTPPTPAENLQKNPDALEDTLVAALIVALVVLAACCCLFLVRPKKTPQKNVKSIQTDPIQTNKPIFVPPILGTTDGRVQLLAAPGFGSAHGAPLWSALVIDSVTVPYEEVEEVQMDINTLEFIVKQTPRTSHGQAGPLLVRVYSRPEFDLWREALYPKILPTQSGEEEEENGREAPPAGS